MTDFQINDYLLQQECERLAKEAIEDIRTNHMDEGDSLEDYQGEISDWLHESIDGYGWVIFHHKAIMICAHCDVQQGEAFLEDIGMPKDPTFAGLASIIVYGEMLARAEEAARDIVEEGMAD